MSTAPPRAGDAPPAPDRADDRAEDRADRLSTGYLHQVDVVRLLTFGSVVAVHVVA